MLFTEVLQELTLSYVCYHMHAHTIFIVWTTNPIT